MRYITYVIYQGDDMSPRQTVFSPAAVADAALALVRRDGQESLSARNVARELRASVTPVYSACGSMEQLHRLVLERILHLLQDYTREPLSAMPFLNIGVGIVRFARDETNLFRALFHTRHGQRDIQLRFHASVLACMQADPTLGQLPRASLERIKDTIWLYTLGLATAIIAGIVTATTDNDIIRLLKDAGNIVMFAEVAGINAADSAQNERLWNQVLHERHLTRPICPPAAINQPTKSTRGKTPTRRKP
jgi:AcrR family transcriptional regulator